MNQQLGNIEQEREWIVRLSQDDEQAFCHLYASYRNRLLYFATRMLKSNEFAEDIFQDTFAAVWNSRRFLNPDASFGAYVYTIMRNRILNLLTELHKHTELQAQLAERSLDTDAQSPSPLTQLEENDLQTIYEEAIKQLTTQQQTVFRLSREEMLTHRQIAEKLHISVNTVQQHISTALRTLRKALLPLNSNHPELILLWMLLAS